EDPVTGGAHTVLGVYWSKLLNKTTLDAYQSSERGGELQCELNQENGRILILENLEPISTTTDAPAIAVTEQNYRQLLKSTLEEVECVNVYCAGDRFEYLCDPQLDGFTTINGILQLPLTIDSGYAIIHKCTRPSIKKGNSVELIADRWELSPSLFFINNPQWNSKLIEDMKSKIPTDLGLNDDLIKQNQLDIKLIKLVLYGKGSCSKPYEIEEKTHGTLGKLVVVLPSTYEGGQDHLIVKKERYVYDFSKNSANSLHYIVYYNNCQHEVQRVSNGFKLTLVYDISHPKTMKPMMYLTPSQSDEQLVEKMNEIFSTWLRHSNRVSKLIIPLTGIYVKSTMSSLSLNSKDRAYINLLLETIKHFHSSSHVCHHLWPHDEFLLYIGVLTHHEELDEDGDVMINYMFVENLILINGKRQESYKSFESIRMVDVDDDVKLIDQTIYDHLDSTFVRENGETGNDVNAYPEIGVLVIVPYHRKFELLFCEKRKLYHKLSFMCSIIESNCGSKLKSIILKQECLEAINCLLRKQQMRKCDVAPLINRLITLYKIKTGIKQIDILVIDVIRRLIQHHWFILQLLTDKTIVRYLFNLGNLVDWLTIEIDIFNGFQRAITQLPPNTTDSSTFLISFVLLVNQTLELSHSMKDDLYRLIMCMINTLLKHIFRQKQIFETTSMITVCSVLELLSLFDDVYLLSLNIISKQIIHFLNKCCDQEDDITERYLEPALILFIKKLWPQFHKQQNVPRWFVDLYEYCLSALNDECNSPPPPIKKWTLDELNISCDCDYCQQLLTFFLDENVHKQQFRKYHRLCSQFNRTIDRLSVSLTSTIQHNGSEQQLEITKPFDTKKRSEKYLMLRDGLLEINISKHIYSFTTNPRKSAMDDDNRSTKRSRME
ncbi:unnamed protein product, partial [Didymodactylos carnosus]